MTQWFEAIRQAIVARTGQSPQTTNPAALAISAEPNWSRKGWPLFFGSLASLGLTCLAISQEAAEALTVSLSFITSILWVASLWYAIGFLQANAELRRGDFDGVTSDEPPQLLAGSDGLQPRPSEGVASVSWKAMASALCSIPSWLIVIGLLTNLYDSLGPDGLPPRGFFLAWFELLVLGTGGFAGLAALFLGAEALREIRHSNGAIRGVRLAVTGLLGIPTGMSIKFVPLLAAALARAFGWQPSEIAGQVFMGCVLIGILMLAALAAAALRRWARFRVGSAAVM